MSVADYQNVKSYISKLESWYLENDLKLTLQIKMAMKSYKGLLPNSTSLYEDKFFALPSGYDWRSLPTPDASNLFSNYAAKLDWLRYMSIAKALNISGASDEAAIRMISSFSKSIEVSNELEVFSIPGNAHPALRPLTTAVRLSNLVESYVVFSEAEANIELLSEIQSLITTDINRITSYFDLADRGDKTNGEDFYTLNESAFSAYALVKAFALTDNVNEENISKAMSYMRKSVETQIYEDGGHIEKSFGYLLSIGDLTSGTKKVLDYIGVDTPTWLHQVNESIHSAINSLTHISGHIPAFSDTPNGVINRKGRDDSKFFNAEDFGYTMYKGEKSKVDFSVIIDHGTTGDSYHGQQDTLSVEIHNKVGPIVMDMGSSEYDESSSLRRYERSSEAHNAISIGGLSHGAINDSKSIVVEKNKETDSGWEFSSHHYGYGIIDRPTYISRGVQANDEGIIHFEDAYKSNYLEGAKINYTIQADAITYLGRGEYVISQGYSAVASFHFDPTENPGWDISISPFSYTISTPTIYPLWNIVLSSDALVGSVNYHIKIENEHQELYMIEDGGIYDLEGLNIYGPDDSETTITLKEIPNGVLLFQGNGRKISSGDEISTIDVNDLKYQVDGLSPLGDLVLEIYNKSNGLITKRYAMKGVEPKNTDASCLPTSIDIGKGQIVSLLDVFDFNLRESDVLIIQIEASSGSSIITDGSSLGVSNVTCTYADLKDLFLKAGDASGTTSISVSIKPKNGDIVSGSVLVSVENHEPKVVTQNISVSHASSSKISDLICTYDEDGDEISRVMLKSNILELNSSYLDTSYHEMSYQDYMNLTWASDSLSGSSGFISMSVFDGEDWSDLQNIDVEIRDNLAPLVIQNTKNPKLGQKNTLDDIFRVVDPDLDQVEAVDIYVAETNFMTIVHQGIQLETSKTYRFKIEDLSSVIVYGGNPDSSGRIIVKASDGASWSEKKSLKFSFDSIHVARIYGSAGSDIISLDDEIGDIYSGPGSDVIYGSSWGDTLNSGDGNDLIYSGGGIDIINAGYGRDTVHGGDGNDSIYGGYNNDRIIGDSGRDIIFGDNGSDYLSGGNDSDSIRGGAGADTIIGGRGADVIYADDGRDLVIGGGHNDSLFGGSGRDTLYGHRGHDFISGGDGSDELSGGVGNDKIFGGVGEDFILGNRGNDTLSGGNGDDNILGGDHSDLIRGGMQCDHISGGNGNDTIYGGRHDDTISGDQGDDVLHGGRGHDFISGASGNDLIFGGKGHDSLSGAGGFDFISGGGGNDLVIGGGDMDTVYGGNGNDTLDGGEGDDLLFGGAGSDTFIFHFSQGEDTISDFECDVDYFLIYGFSDLCVVTTAQDDMDCIVSVNGEIVARLLGVDVSHFDASNIIYGSFD